MFASLCASAIQISFISLFRFLWLINIVHNLLYLGKNTKCWKFIKNSVKEIKAELINTRATCSLWKKYLYMHRRYIHVCLMGFHLENFCCTEQFSFYIWVMVSAFGILCQWIGERQVTSRDASDAITGGLVCNFGSLESAICNRFTAIYNHRLHHLAVIGCRHQKEAPLRDAPRSFKTTRFMQMMTQKRQQMQSRYRVTWWTKSNTSNFKRQGRRFL